MYLVTPEAAAYLELSFNKIHDSDCYAFNHILSCSLAWTKLIIVIIIYLVAPEAAS